MLLLPIEPIFLFTVRRPHWKSVPLFIIGLAIVVAGPAGHYAGFNRWVERTGGLVPEAEPKADDALPTSWGASGIEWIPGYQKGRTGPALFLETAGAYLISFEWPNDGMSLSGREPAPVQYWVYRLAMFGMGTLLAFCLLGALPWPDRWRKPLVADPARHPWWRTLLWLALWLLLPAYGFFYCRSVPTFQSPRAWAQPIIELWAGRWFLAGTIVVVLTVLISFWRPHAWMLAALNVVALPVVVFVLLAKPAPGGVYSPQVREQAIHWLQAGGALLVLPLLWRFCGTDWRSRGVRTLQFVAVGAVVVGLCYLAYAWFDHVRLAFRDTTLAENPQAKWEELWEDMWRSLWMPRYVAIVFPAFAIAVAALLMRLPTRPLRGLAVAVLLGANLTNAFARMHCGSEPPVDRMAADIAAAETRGPIRTFIDEPYYGAHPGTGTLYTAQGRYYLCMALDRKALPIEIRRDTGTFMQAIGLRVRGRSSRSRFATK